MTQLKNKKSALKGRHNYNDSISDARLQPDGFRPVFCAPKGSSKEHQHRAELFFEQGPSFVFAKDASVNIWRGVQYVTV